MIGVVVFLELAVFAGLLFYLARARGFRFERPVAIERVLFASAALLLVVSVFIALQALTSSYHDRELDRGRKIAEQSAQIADLRTQLDQAAGLTSCRSKLASNLADKQTDEQIATADLVVAIARHAEDRLPAIIDAIEKSSTATAEARDLRVEWEANPGPCPL